jgi:hypothetical protein
MIGAGTFINPLMRVLVAVAILAAAYFFIVRPALDTTEKAFETVSPAFEGLNDVGSDIRRSVRHAERIQTRQAEASAARTKEASKLLGCIGDASGDVAKINRCNQRYPVTP